MVLCNRESCGTDAWPFPWVVVRGGRSATRGREKERCDAVPLGASRLAAPAMVRVSAARA
jgi:hypothetical protein